MPLQKQVLPISLSQGVDTKSDPKQVVPGKLLLLENGVFKTSKEIRLRDGMSDLNSSLSAGNAISAYNAELVSLDGFNVYSYNAKSNTQINKGPKVALDFAVQSIVRNQYEQFNGDSGFGSGLYVYAYQETSGGVRYSVIDASTGQSIVNNSLIDSGGVTPKVKFFSGKFIIVYTVGTAVNYRTVDPSTPTVLSGATVLDADAATFDFSIISTRLFFITNGSTFVKLFYLDSSYTKSAVTTTAFVADAFVTIWGDVSNNVWIAFHSTSGVLGYRYAIYTFNLAVVLAVTTIELDSVISLTSGVEKSIVGIFNSTSSQVYYEIHQQNGAVPIPYDTYIRTANLTVGGVVSGVKDFERSVGIYSKPFIYNTVIYIWVTHDSNLQPTYFLLDSNKNIVAKVAPSVGGGLSGVQNPSTINDPYIYTQRCEVNSISTGVFQIPYLIKDLIEANATADNPAQTYSQLGVNSAIFTYGGPIISTELGFDDHFSGGIVSMYDGGIAVEHGFSVYPENLIIDYIPAQGAANDGAFLIEQTYEWVDNQGNIHRSAPSVGNNIDTATFSGRLYVSGTQVAAHEFTTTDDASQFYIGMRISATGLTNPTVVVRVTFSAGTWHVFTDTSTTLPAGTTLYTVHPQYSLMHNDGFSIDWDINLTKNSKTALVDPIQTFPIFASFINGAALCSVYDTTKLKVGMTLFNPDQFPAGVQITAISGNVVTISSPATKTITDEACQIQEYWTPNTSTTGGPVTVSIPHNLALILSVGQTVFSSNINTGDNTSLITVINTGANTITIADGTTAATPATFTALMDASNVLRVGQSISAVGVPSGTFITSVTSGHDVADATITMSELATLTNSELLIITGVNTIALKLPTLRVTNKTGNTPVSLIVYRTLNDGTILFRSSDLSLPTTNDVTADYVLFLDQVSDNVLDGRNQIYTTGGVVDNIQVPASGILGVFQDRVFAIPEEDPLTFWFSKQVVENQPVEFSDLLVGAVSEPGGDITGFGAMDDKVIFFKHNIIFYMVGSGPADTGLNDTFTEPQIVQTDSGCINKKSIVRIPSGLMYQSNKGIYLLDRSLSVQYIGADVELYNNQTITSAILADTVNQVRYTLQSGVILVYDYYFNQWSVFTNQSAVDACLYNNIYTYIKSGGVIVQETPGVFIDNASAILLQLTTSFFSLAALQGFQRIYKILMLGQWISQHTLTVKLFYDFSSTVGQTDSIVVNSAPTPAYQFRIFPNQQKCESIQLNLLVTPTAPIGEAMSISAFGIEFGVKQGLDKLAAAVSYG